MGKSPFSFRRTPSRRRSKKTTGSPQRPPKGTTLPSPPPKDNVGDGGGGSIVAATAVTGGISVGAALAAAGGKGKKKAGGARMWPWMRFDRAGLSEMFECEKIVIVCRVSIPARDLLILSPVFSHSSNILARDKAMVVNLEFIKAIVTAEEVLILDPLRHEVLPFVDQLRQQLPPRIASKAAEGGTSDAIDNEMQVCAGRHWLPVPEAAEGLQYELPFEFQVLEIALEVVCTYLDSNVADLEIDAYPTLYWMNWPEMLARKILNMSSLKSNLTRLLARVQKVRDEIEHLLDDDEDMAQLSLSRKWIQAQQLEALGAGNSFSISPARPSLHRISSTRSGSVVTSNYAAEHDVEDLEMLLESYFMQLDGTRNKILSVREYIDDTEDYVNIQLDHQRNELIQLQLFLTIASFAIAIETLIAGAFGMNIPCQLYNINGIFGLVVGVSLAFCSLVFLLMLGYARWKKLLGS